MTKDQEKNCHFIIHMAAVGAGSVGAGLAQIPTADNVAITPIQVAMIMALGQVFKVDIGDAGAKSALVAASAGFVGRTVSQVAVGWIPGYGNAVNAATAAGLTEAIGWAIAHSFDAGEIPA